MLTRNSESYSALDDEADADLVDNGRNRSSANPTGLLDAANFWLLLRWRASLIAVVAVATVLVAAAALTMLPPKYKATSVVLVDPRQPRVTNAEAVISGIGADAAAVESQVEIIESSTLAKRVIKKLNLSQDPDFASPSLTDWVGDGLAAMLGADAKTINETRANRLEYKFQSGLTVRRRGLTYV